MNPRLVWGIAPAIVICAALLAAYQVTREVDTQTYLTVEKNWTGLDAETQQEIASMVDDGKLTRWEWVRGIRLIMDSRGILFGTMRRSEDTHENARRQVVELAHETRAKSSSE